MISPESPSRSVVVCEGYHERARPEAKAHAWSYMAHRWPEDGCEEFFEHLWRDDVVRQALIARMGDAWRVARELVSAPSDPADSPEPAGGPPSP